MRRIIAITLVWVVVASCASNASKERSVLYSTVPSRAVVVMHFDKLRPAVEFLLDSSSVFRGIDFGRLSHCEMILSYDYGAALVPLLSIDTGHDSADTSSVVGSVIRQAESHGLYALYTADMLPQRSALLLSPSRTAIEEARIHIAEGSSILDAPHFDEALALSEGKEGRIIFRNSSAVRWLPKTWFADIYSRRSVASFLSDAAEWMVLDFDNCKSDNIPVRFYGGRKNYLCEFTKMLPSARCLAARAVPDSASFVISLPLGDCGGYLKSWEECQDSRAMLSRYKGRLAALGKRLEKRPADWLASYAPKELVRVRWDDKEVLLLRSAKKKRSSEPAENPFPGYIPALFGEAFRLQDDSFTAVAGAWTAFGSETAVSAWLESVKCREFKELPGKIKYFVKAKELSIFADDKKVLLNVNRTRI